MNQRGPNSRLYLGQLTSAPEGGRTVSYPADAARALERGARILFYERRGDGDDVKVHFTGWGEIERFAAEEETVKVTLREYHALKRRVPFGELRADPRRDPDAELQPVTADIFNTVLSKGRR
jgi:hypothetical protein